VKVPNAVEAFVSMVIEAANVIVRDNLPSAVRVDSLKLIKSRRRHVFIIETSISIQLKDSGRINLSILIPIIDSL